MADDKALVFIRDEASDEDFFGSHNRIAAAISSVIRTQADLKVIGLLGPWGSGKSTVVRLLQSQLQKDDDTKTYCFSYDAWLHQNDPPRRSFLETLIHYLIANKLTSEQKWQDRLAQLNRQVEDTETTSTPTLTTSGRLIILSLFLLPLGIQFVGYDWFNAAFGATPSAKAWGVFLFGVACLLLPALIALGVYVFWRPKKWPFCREFWRAKNWATHGAPHERESILSLFMNKHVQRLRNRVTRAPDPTTIEFQDIFREIMEAVDAPKRRFLFVIDNLDRLPETEAVVMWSTIRSFFLGAQETNHVRKNTKLPTVILPIDEDAVRRMYAVSHTHDAPLLARSFMDKTFDLTFRVTRPVLSDWNAYLAKQMQTVFGQYLSADWPYLTGRLYEKFLTGQNGPAVTPRTINTLINTIATLWLQWREAGIEFASIAYYAIYRDFIDSNILAAVATPQAGIDEFDPNWRRAIAAIHYGVMPSDALQVLIEQPLRKAIADKHAQDFAELSVVPGFERVLQRILDQAAATEDIELAAIFNVAQLLETLNPPAEAWVSPAWKTLRSGFRRTGTWKTFGPEEASSIKALVAHCDARDLASFIATIRTKLSSLGESAINRPAFPDSFVTTWKELFAAAKAQNVPLPRVPVPGLANVFLSVATACGQDVELLTHLDTTVPDADIVKELATDLPDNARAIHAEIRFRALIARGARLPWDALLAAAGLFVKDQNATHFGMNAALLCLGLLRHTEEAAANQIKQLSDNGSLISRLTEAHAQNRDVTEARLLALLILTTPGFAVPDGGQWDAQFTSRPQLAQIINTALLEFDSEDNVDLLVASASANAALLQIVRAVISLRVRGERLGKLQVSAIISNLSPYLNCVEDGLHDSFVQQLSYYETFWEELRKQPLDENAIVALRVLIKEGYSQTDTARALLKDLLDAVPIDKWEAAVKTGEEPFQVATALADVGGPLQIGSQLFDALQKLTASFLSSPDGDFRKRWLMATELITPSAMHILFKNLRDLINGGTVVSDLVSFLTIGGGTLLREGGFTATPDESVRHIIIPLLSMEKGVEWLVGQTNDLRSWINNSDEKTKSFLAERISELEKESDDGGKNQLRKLREAWPLPELPAVKTASDDEADDKGNESDLADAE